MTTIDTLIQLSYEEGYNTASGEYCEETSKNRKKLRDKLLRDINRPGDNKKFFAFVVLPSGKTIAYYDSEYDSLIGTVISYLNVNHKCRFKNLKDLRARAYDLWIVVDFFKTSDAGRLIPIY
jgi:hypothetical protein